MIEEKLLLLSSSVMVLGAGTLYLPLLLLFFRPLSDPEFWVDWVADHVLFSSEVVLILWAYTVGPKGL